MSLFCHQIPTAKKPHYPSTNPNYLPQQKNISLRSSVWRDVSVWVLSWHTYVTLLYVDALAAIEANLTLWIGEVSHNNQAVQIAKLYFIRNVHE